MNVLISGCGVAGPNLAWWLLRSGHEVTLVEKAPELRTGGYIIDFWGRGYDLAERMGLMPRLQEVGYHVEDVALVDDDGKRAGGFGGKVFTRVSGGRYITLPRGELAAALYRAIEGRAEVLFGDTIAALDADADGVDVTFEHAAPRKFDLVVGAEGIHSRTRDLAFGPEDRFERFLGYCFAAFVLEGYVSRSEDTYVMHGEPGREALRFALRDGSTLVLLIWKEDGDGALPHDAEGAKALLRERFAGCSWEVPQMLAALDKARDLYVDRVSQIRMEGWHKGRVALVGDAAFAPSFLAGQGAALAMIGGYVLAGELGSSGSVEAGLAAYENRLADFMRGKQEGAARFASTFVPETRLGLRLRGLISHFLRIDWVADAMFGGEIRDQIDLPDYA